MTEIFRYPWDFKNTVLSSKLAFLTGAVKNNRTVLGISLKRVASSVLGIDRATDILFC